MKRHIIFCLLASVLISALQAQTFIFDANDTILYFSRFTAAKEKLSDAQFTKAFIAYCFEIKQNPMSAFKYAQSRAYEVLNNYCKDNDSELESCYSNDVKMPLLMARAMRGDLSECAIQLYGRLATDLFDKQKKFISKNERIVLSKIIHLMFCSESLIKIIQPFEDTEAFIKKYSKMVDASGKPKHQFFILSNMQKEVFDKMKKHKPLKKLFKYIPESHWIMSAQVHKVKPNKNIYEYILNTFNLDAKECVFVDDQRENTEAAADLGFNVILCTKDRKTVLNQLKTFAQK